MPLPKVLVKRLEEFTARRPLTFKFRPTDDEQRLYEAVSEYLPRENTFAFPKRQRHLSTLILRKLLASSSRALAAAAPFHVVPAQFWLPIGTVEAWEAAQSMDLASVLTAKR